MKKQLLLNLLVILTLAVFSSCGGSSTSDDDGGGGGGSSNATTESNAEAIAQTLCAQTASSQTNANANPALMKYTTFEDADCSLSGSVYSCTANCDDSGTTTYNYNVTTEEMSFEFDQCEEDGWTQDGTIPVEYDAGPPEEITITFIDYTESDGTTTLTLNGDTILTYDESTNEGTMTFDDCTATDDSGNSYTVNGSVTMDEDNVMNGTMTINDGSDTVTCTFTDLDADTATEADYEAACSL